MLKTNAHEHFCGLLYVPTSRGRHLSPWHLDSHGDAQLGIFGNRRLCKECVECITS